MIAYKLLRAGRSGPFSKFVWPEPGVCHAPAPRRINGGAAFTHLVARPAVVAS